MSKKNKISEQEVKKIAELSRLSLTNEELKKRTKDMNNILDYIETNCSAIDEDQSARNSSSKKKHGSVDSSDTTKTRKKREELSISATKCIKKENVKIMVKFN